VAQKVFFSLQCRLTTRAICREHKHCRATDIAEKRDLGILNAASQEHVIESRMQIRYVFRGDALEIASRISCTEKAQQECARHFLSPRTSDGAKMHLRRDSVAFLLAIPAMPARMIRQSQPFHRQFVRLPDPTAHK